MEAAGLLVNKFFSDSYLFPAIQYGLILLAVIGAARHIIHHLALKNPIASITRGEKSMRVFYSVYATISGLLIALSLSVDYAENHRVLFVLLDIGLVAYLCLWNPWFRNMLIGWSVQLAETETH